MTKGFFPHFSAVFFVHVFVLMGTWQLSQTEFVQTKLKSLGDGVLKMQVATRMMTAPAIKKKTVATPRLVPSAEPLKKSTIPETITEPVAASSGEGSEFGTSANGTTDIKAVYRAELRAMIDKNKYYPPLSRRLGQTGTVVVAFTLLKDGNIIDVRIDKPSRYDRLNDSALDAVKKVEKFKPIPAEIGATKMDIKVPVKFFTI